MFEVNVKNVMKGREEEDQLGFGVLIYYVPYLVKNFCLCKFSLCTFYEKPTASTRVLKATSAYSWQAKLVTMHIVFLVDSATQ